MAYELYREGEVEELIKTAVEAANAQAAAFEARALAAEAAVLKSRCRNNVT